MHFAFSSWVTTLARLTAAGKRRYRSAALVVVGACAVGACDEPATEVVLTVYSDVPCEAQVAVAIGPAGELGDRAASSTSTVCDPATGARGVLVVVPKASDTGEVALEARIRADQQPPENCVLSAGYDGCIIARRILNYIPGRSVRLRMDLKNPCLNTPCTQTTTCVAQGLGKSCVEAHVDPNQCNGTCTDDDQLAQNQGGGAGGEGGASGEAGSSGEGGASGEAGSSDPCAHGQNPCSADATCVSHGDQAECRCPQGFENAPNDATACMDIDECATASDDCANHASCTNVAGGFDCACDPGYSGDRTACVDIDECAAKTSDCAAKAVCTNTEGGFTCKCPAGYSGTGQVCTPLCATAPIGLVGWWSGDQDGTDLVAAHNATLTSLTAGQEAHAGVAGVVAGAFDFSGATSFASVANDAALNVGTGDFSLALWVHANCSGVCVLVDKRDPASETGYVFYLNSNALGFQLTDTVAQNFPGGGNGLSDGLWHFVVASVQRSSATGLHFYVDGKLSATTNPTSRPGSLDNTAALRFALRTTDSGAHLNAGGLDEVQLYKRALSATDVQTLWAAGKYGVCK